MCIISNIGCTLNPISTFKHVVVVGLESLTIRVTIILTVIRVIVNLRSIRQELLKPLLPSIIQFIITAAAIGIITGPAPMRIPPRHTNAEQLLRLSKHRDNRLNLTRDLHWQIIHHQYCAQHVHTLTQRRLDGGHAITRWLLDESRADFPLVVDSGLSRC